MPIFRSTPDGLHALRPVFAGPDLYEKEIEDLLWANPGAFYGVELFPVCRQPVIGSSRPDVVALTAAGTPVVIEVKRSIDRSQLAQCLEYAGWARTVGLDELADRYHTGHAAFFRDWQAFTGGSTPVIVSGHPQLVLIAQDFDERTASALAYLADLEVPVFAVATSVFQDELGQRFYLIDSEYQDDPPEGPSSNDDGLMPRRFTKDGRRYAVADLISAGLIRVGEELRYTLPRGAGVAKAVVMADGQIELATGGVFATPSLAAKVASGAVAVAGWDVWVAPRLDSKRLYDLRAEHLASMTD